MVVTYSFFGGMFPTLHALWVVRELGFSAATLGLLLSAGGLGAILGAFFVSPLTRRLGLGATVTLSYLGAASLMWLVPLAGGPAWLALSILLAELLFGDILWIVHNVSALSLRQAIVPREQIGRVNATFLLASQGMRPIGAIVAGFAAEALGVRDALFLTAGGVTIAGIWLILSPLPHLKAVPLGESS